MTVPSTTPEGPPDACPLCGSALPIGPAGAVACVRCGCGIWFDPIPSELDLILAVRDDKLDELDGIDRLMKIAEERGLNRLVLDFGRFQTIASADLGRLFRLRVGPGRRKKLAVRGLNSVLREVFRITRLDEVFEVIEPWSS